MSSVAYACLLVHPPFPIIFAAPFSPPPLLLETAKTEIVHFC